MDKVSWLWRPPRVNPDSGKALTLPLLNPYDVYGRCFHLAWLGFFVAFLSWFAFPPLMSTISEDLGLTPAQVSNSNIVGLCSTLLARFILGPLCDRFGPRWVMAGTLLVGAISTAFVPFVNSASGVYAIRFFIGFLGGTFVPCQYWTTVFFDKTIVGVANALAGGWGNAGGGVAFFSMPAVQRSLQRRGYSVHDSWHYSFDVYPLIVIIFVAIITLLLGQDCPEGRWADRTRFITTIQGENGISDPEIQSFARRKPGYDVEYGNSRGGTSRTTSVPEAAEEGQSDFEKSSHVIASAETAHPADGIIPALSKISQFGAKFGVHEEPIKATDPNETIAKPTKSDIFRVAFSLPTMLNAIAYASTFGGELAIESIISSLYAAHARKQGHTWSSQYAGDWGSMLGLLNIVTRPLGGFISDQLYRQWSTPLVKKIWMLLCGFIMGIFLLYIGLYKGISMAGLIVSMAFMSLFMEMGNGANFSLVPHTNPHHTGIVAGTTGSFGNAGGVLFSLAFRFSTLPSGQTDYQSALWYIGVTVMGVNALCVLLPLGKNDTY